MPPRRPLSAAIIWPLVGLTALAMMATGFAVLAFAQRMLLAGLERRASSLAATALAMQEHAEGVAVLRIFGSGGDDFAGDVARLRTGAWRGVKRVTPIAILFRTTIDLSAAASILVAVIVFADSSSAGTDALRLALAALLIFSATVPARNFASLTAILLLARLSRRNIESILRVSLLPQSETTVVPRSFDLSYRQVCFTHKGKTELALSDISFDANQGQMIALVGASGSGKTTCLQLMMRFWDPDSGNILIGGHDAAAMDNAVLAATFAPVFQETLLFDDTIGNNIRLGRQSASDAEVVEAARAAAIHHTIIKLQDGYDTRVGALGSRLSGGERQRVCIARAILRDAPIIVLDEATSSLDPENEEAIQKAVTALSAGRTLFVIAHNLRSVVAADKILLMKEGHIEAVGTHEELLQTSSTYGQLWERSTDGHGWSLSAL
ncbi:ABC transporter ATP-binding protein [Ensifer sp. NPDC090286]|uniref:ABC transporter ATP-binding protein n=1 Tax=Ensifer sp. NPDC090286 TaxID=3363991 RepID=UPI00383BB53C